MPARDRPANATWSATRAKMFEQCPRRYWYRYHLAPTGRAPGATPEAKEAWKVKDLVGAEAWRGDLVHRVIERILGAWRAGREQDEASTLNMASQMLSREFVDSQRYWDAPADEFSKRPPLLDFHYFHDRDFDRDAASELKERVIGSIRGFLRSEIAAQIRAAGPSSWLPIDRNAAAQLPNEDITILVKPDFAYRTADRLCILDWKTGRPDPTWETVQLVAYVLYAEQKWSVQRGQVDPYAVYLHPEFKKQELPGPHAFEEALAIIRDSQEQILSLVGDGPMPKRELFVCTESKKLCQWCSFRGVCSESGTQSSA